MQERKNTETIWGEGLHLSFLPPLPTFFHTPGPSPSPNLKDFTKSQAYMEEQVIGPKPKSP